jgi:YVTN family beta-propeller protein
LLTNLIQRYSLHYFILFIILLILQIPISFSYQQQIEENRKVISDSLGKSVLPVGSYPIGIGVNSVTNRLYVANQFSNSISVIDGNTDIIESTIQVDSFPYDLEVNPFNNRIYVTNRESNTVSVIDGSTNQRLSNINVEDSPVGISINPSLNMVYVTNLESKSLSIIDGIDNKVNETIKFNEPVYGVAVNPLTNLVYISNLINNTLSVLDGKTNKIIDKIAVENLPTAININYKTNLIYVTNYLANSISVIDGITNKVISTIKVAKYPVDTVVNPLTNKVYVSHNGDDTALSIIDGVTNKKIKELSFKSSINKNNGNNDPTLDIPIKVTFPLIASRLAVNPDTTLIYMTNTVSNGVMVISGQTDSVVVRLSVDINPKNSGTIECNNSKLQSQNFLLLPINNEIKCIAHASRGYSFDFWSDMTNTISNNTNPLALNVTENNLLIANFKPSISTETYIGMVAAIVGSTSIFAGWYYRKRERSYLNKSMNRIDYTYDVLKNDKVEGIKQLENIQKEITILFKKGRITDSHYNILDKRITDLINTFYRKE